ncbi:MMPL family transporter [Pseudonocardia saturnea]
MAESPAVRRLRRSAVERYTAAVVAARWWVLVAVALATTAATLFLPSLTAVGGGLAGLLGGSSAAVQAQVDAVKRFGLPLLSPTAVVQRDPGGLDPYLSADSLLAAAEVVQDTVVPGGGVPGGSPDDLLLAYPVLNTPLLFPGAAEQGTTVVTYLFIDPTVGIAGQGAITREYAAGLEIPDGGLVGSTGTFLAQAAQNEIIAESLPLVELATLAAIALIVGLNFGSVLAPVVTLITAGVGYLVTDRMIGLFGELTDLAVPSQLQPLVVALLLGITTDYTIFFLSGVSAQYEQGRHGRAAVRAGMAVYLPIVLVAGITVAAGVSALLVAESPLFRAFGPGLAITVLVGLAVSVTMVPALLAILGRAAFWPSRPGAGTDPGRAQAAPSRGPGRYLRLVGRRWVAASVTGVMVALLVAAALPLADLRSGVAPVAALPPENPVRVAAEAAAAGFAPGILGPTEVILSAPGIATERAALDALGSALERTPGVSAVLGPGDQPLQRELGLFLAPGGDAARILLVFDSDPLGATAINRLAELRDRMPALLAAAGLAGAEVAYAGDTAVGLPLVETASGDLGRVAVAVLLVDLLLLVVFLRAVVAPLYLLATSVLAVGAALGLTTWIFQAPLDQDGLIFYVPFAAGVLLISLGSDYNIFSVGYVWEEARRRPLREALAVAVPRSTRAITAAGLTLAASFGFIALIPIATFRQLALALALGVLIDAFVVRPLLVPALISLFGRFSGWPGRRLAGPAGGTPGGEPERPVRAPAPAAPLTAGRRANPPLVRRGRPRARGWDIPSALRWNIPRALRWNIPRALPWAIVAAGLLVAVRAVRRRARRARVVRLGRVHQPGP